MPALRVSVLLSAVALLCARHGECVERGAPPYLATAIPRTSAPGSRQPLQQQKNPPRRRRSEGPMQASKKRIEIAATERIVHADGSVTLPPAAEENIPEHEKPRLYYHEGWKTCTIEGTNVESMNGRYFSLGSPSKDFGGVQMFASDSMIRGVLPHQLLFIPAKANENGDFDRWVIFNSFSVPQVPLGRADHSQIFQTTNSSHGTVWETHISKRALAASRNGDSAFLDEMQTLIPPTAPPRCEPGHIFAPGDRVLRVALMKAPVEANVPLESGVSPRAQVLNRARLECQAFTFSYTQHQRPVGSDTTEAMMAGKAVCAHAIEQPVMYLDHGRLFSLKMGAAHHDLMTRHLRQAADKYIGVIREFAHWQDQTPFLMSGKMPPDSLYNIYHDVIPTLIQARRYEIAELMYEQMLFAKMYEEPRQEDRTGTRAIQKRIDTLLPLVKLRLKKYKEAAEILAVNEDRYDHDYVSAFLLEWTVQTMAKQGVELPPDGPIRRAYNRSLNLFSAEVGRGTNHYQGFIPPNSSWTPRRFERLPTHAEMIDYVRRREPFIISPPANPKAFGGNCSGLPGTCPVVDLSEDCPPLLHLLGWERTCLWDADVMCGISGNKQVSLAMKSNDTQDMDTFSGSTTNSRNFTSFCSFARAVLDPDSPNKDISKTVGYFDAGSANAISGGTTHVDGNFSYDFPLDKLVQDIPLPAFLSQQSTPGAHPTEDIVRAEFANETILKMYSATFWMGSAARENAGQCGLHYDALENFHVLLSGRKRWKIYSPADALNLDYILPVQNVSEEGDIHQVDWDGDLKVFNIQTRFSKVTTVHQGMTDLIREHHPRLARATQIEFEIDGGSAVYVPGGWAHDISSHGIYRSITHWFFRDHTQFRFLEGEDKVKKIIERLDNPAPKLNFTTLRERGEWVKDAILSETL